MSALAKQQLAELNALLGTACFTKASPLQALLYAVTPQSSVATAMGGIIEDAADEVLALSDACRASSMNEQAIAGALTVVHRRLLAAAKLAELLYQAGEP